MRSQGLVQCGVRLLGTNADDSRRYVWLLCTDDRTGPSAVTLSGGSSGAVLSFAGRTGAWRLTDVAIPRPAHLEADIDRLFPPSVASTVRRGDLRVVPDPERLLATARGLPAGRPCTSTDLGAAQVTGPGDPALGTIYAGLRLVDHGRACLLVAGGVTARAGRADRTVATLELDGRETLARLVPHRGVVRLWLAVPNGRCAVRSPGTTVPVWTATVGGAMVRARGGEIRSAFAVCPGASLVGRVGPGGVGVR